MEFDASGASKRSTLIWIFQDGFKPSIAAQIKQCGQEHDTWEELVKKAIEAEVKVRFLPSPFIQNIHQRCPQGNRFATWTNSQTSSAWDPQDERFKKT